MSAQNLGHEDEPISTETRIYQLSAFESKPGTSFDQPCSSCSSTARNAVSYQQPQHTTRQIDWPQILLILVGLPGSGKTTFAESLVALSENEECDPPTNPTFDDRLGSNATFDNQLRHEASGSSSNTNSLRRTRSRKWIRASQDDAPNRRRQECEARVRWALNEGYNVIVDRVGFDPVQRSHFITIADSYSPRPLVYCLILSVSHPTLVSRLFSRTSHPTIPDAETGLRVLQQMESQFQPPSNLPNQGEGLDRIYTLEERDQPPDRVWDEERLRGVLRDIEEEGEVEIVHLKEEEAEVEVEVEEASMGMDTTGEEGEVVVVVVVVVEVVEWRESTAQITAEAFGGDEAMDMAPDMALGLLTILTDKE
ncbi:hypothetical protein I317_04211 [Kwoniella heveanensis CBS 569]|nr:hypothetical protein I317_04211 [Kwoniella heveanensis CBS 569]